MQKIHSLFLFSVLILGTPSLLKSQVIDKTTVKDLDLNRYMGKWYEIARFPHFFEKDLVGVTATYRLLEDGMIEVKNEGVKYKLDGEKSLATGKGKLPDKADPGKLKVSFFWIFYADYYVLELDTLNYQYAMIGSSSDKYFWILCRTSHMDDLTYNMLLDKARKRGYQLDKLYKVPQN